VGDRAAARRALNLDPHQSRLVCVSRLSREKGIDLLVDAMAQVRERGVCLTVVGDGPEYAALVARRDRLGLAGRVDFVGRRDHDEIPRWMAAADAVVLSSRTEGHPNVLVEALASGRPVVATRVGGVPEIVTGPELGIVVPPEDAAALARGIDDALARVWDTGTLARAARARTWHDVADDLHRILAGGLA
jgi:glycosyltransferase involved in cell wall biosynthesis